MSVIYKIYCLDENIKDCYIGSTNNFYRRKLQHKHDCNNINSNNYTFKVYEFIRANGGWENFDFMILEQFENKIIKKDLEKIEGQYIKNNNSNLNCNIAGRSQKTHYEDNKMHFTNYKKEWYNKNKEKLSEKAKENYQKNKSYRQTLNKQNYEKTKEKLSEKVKCEFCKCVIRKDCLKRHQKTKKCLDIQS